MMQNATPQKFISNTEDELEEQEDKKKDGKELSAPSLLRHLASGEESLLLKPLAI